MINARIRLDPFTSALGTLHLCPLASIMTLVIVSVAGSFAGHILCCLVLGLGVVAGTFNSISQETIFDYLPSICVQKRSTVKRTQQLPLRR